MDLVNGPNFVCSWRNGTASLPAMPSSSTTTQPLRAAPGLFLEDIYVRDQYRGKGIGKALLARVAAIAREENCFGVRWQVLDWNTPAIEFYKSLGAKFLDEWKTISLEGDALERLAAELAE